MIGNQLLKLGLGKAKQFENQIYILLTGVLFTGDVIVIWIDYEKKVRKW